MKLISKVSPLQVKRTFIVSDRLAHQKAKKSLQWLSKEEFSKRLERVKTYALKLDAKQIDRFIGKWQPRLVAYKSVAWYLGEAKTSEVGVWHGAGGLPEPWTKGSLKATAEKFNDAVQKKSKRLKRRIKRAVPGILRTSIDFIQSDKYLLPIILPGGTIKGARKGLRKMKGDIDDGCMRSIALTVSGRKTIKAYIGVKKTDLKK